MIRWPTAAKLKAKQHNRLREIGLIRQEEKPALTSFRTPTVRPKSLPPCLQDHSANTLAAICRFEHESFYIRHYTGREKDLLRDLLAQARQRALVVPSGYRGAVGERNDGRHYPPPPNEKPNIT